MIYIGSTIQELKRRLWEHNIKRNNNSSIPLIEFGDVSIHLIREVECNTLLELHIEEQIEMDKYDGELCNNKRAYRSAEIRKEQRRKQAIKDEKTDKRKETKKKYRNTDKRKEDTLHRNYWNRHSGLRAISILKPLFHDI
jgi:hypothetical protein